MAKIVETPLMKQYFDIKAKHPDAILLFRVGDFYEMYGEDAVTGAEILGIVQTKKANGPGQTIEMAGFPHHALDSYLPKLVRAGKRVAICDQLEDPKLTKKLVKRGITELVTPGVSINDNILNHKENNFLAAIHFGKDVCGIAFLDISTGEFLTAEGTVDYVDKLLNNFSPKEVLVERGSRKRFEEAFGPRFFIFELDDWVFTSEAANDRLLKHFETKNLKGFGVQHLKLGVVASGAILYYLDQTQHTHISHITSLSRIEEDRYVRLDKFTVRSLELVSTMNEEGTSLLDVLDKTVSPMGSRMLRRWILFPLKDVKPIHERQDVVEYFFRHPEVKELLATVINSLALSSALVAQGVKAKVLTAIRMEPIGEFYNKWRAIELLEQGHVVIMSGGTGNPFFTTDTGSSLRGIEIEADVMLKGTRVDGIYTADPEKDPTATKFSDITYDEIYTRGLKVMDLTATTMCKENNLPIIVFDMDTNGNLKKVMSGENIGTLVHN